MKQNPSQPMKSVQMDTVILNHLKYLDIICELNNSEKRERFIHCQTHTLTIPTR